MNLLCSRCFVICVFMMVTLFTSILWSSSLTELSSEENPKGVSLKICVFWSNYNFSWWLWKLPRWYLLLWRQFQSCDLRINWDGSVKKCLWFFHPQAFKICPPAGHAHLLYTAAMTKLIQRMKMVKLHNNHHNLLLVLTFSTQHSLLSSEFSSPGVFRFQISSAGLAMASLCANTNPKIFSFIFLR